ncbi:chaplin family protein [Streptomyces sp. NPDC002523]
MRQTLSRGVFAAAAATSVLSLCGSPALADAVAGGSTDTSPGVLSGNTVQVPVDVPVNACGNTVDVVALLNPAFGNSCGNSAPAGSAAGGSAASGSTSKSPGVGSGNTVQVPVDVSVNACGNTVDVVALLNPAFGNSCGNPSGPAVQNTPQIPRQTGSSSTAQPPAVQNTPEIPRQTGSSSTAQPPAPTTAGTTPPVSRTPAPRPPAPVEQQRPDAPTAPVRHTPAAPERQHDAVHNTPATSATSATPAALAETGSGTTLAASGVSATLIMGGVILYRRGRVMRRR